MFGGNQGSNSLFGGGAQGQSSLFGGGQQQNQSQGLALGASGLGTGVQGGGSLFGGNKPAQSSIFGGQTQQQQPAGGSLFGQQSQQSSLFGGQQNKPAGGGLFGTNPTPSLTTQGSLFGGPSAQPSLGGGNAFGAQPLGGTQQPSLFNQTSFAQPTTQGASLFNQPTAQSTFSLQQQQTPQYSAQIINPYLGLKTTDQFGAQSSFLGQKSPFENTEEELRKLKEEIEKNKVQYDPFGAQLGPLEKRGSDSMSAYPADVDIMQQLPLTFADEREKKAAQTDILKSMYSNIFTKSDQAYPDRQPVVYNMQRGFTSSPQTNLTLPAAAYRQQKTFGTDSSFNSRQTTMRYQNQFTTPQPHDYIEPIMEESILRERSEVSDAIETDYKLANNPQLLQIQVTFPDYKSKPEKQATLRIHASRNVIELKTQISEELRKEARLDQNEDFILIFRNTKLKEDQSLKDAGIVTSTKLSIVYKDRKYEDNGRQSESRYEYSDGGNLSKQSSVIYCPEDRLPKPPKQGYSMAPSMIEIARMSFEDVQRVRNFRIWNQYGEVEFPGETDLTDVDLADIVTISPKSVEVYEDERHAETKPQVGQKLNKQAIILLKNIILKANQTEKNLKELASKAEAEHIRYDPDTKEWKFKVFHFTKYGLGDDDDEEEEEQEQQQEEPYQDIHMEQDQNQMLLSQPFREQPAIVPQSFQQKPIIDKKGALTQSKIREYEEQQRLLDIEKKKEQAQTRQINEIKQSNIMRLEQLEENYLDIGAIRQNKRKLPTDQQSVQSSVVDQSQPDSEMIDLQQIRSKRFQEIQPVGNEERVSVVAIKNLKDDVMAKISKNDYAYQQTKQLYQERKSKVDTMKFLKEKLGIKDQDERLLLKLNKQPRQQAAQSNLFGQSQQVNQIFQNPPNQSQTRKAPTNNMYRFRPQFRSDGSLLILNTKQNKVGMCKIATLTQAQNDEGRISYQGLRDILMKHITLKDFDQDEFEKSFRLMGFQQQQATNYDDQFMGELITKTKFPLIEVNDQTPNGAFKLLDEIAQHLVSMISCQNNLIGRKEGSAQQLLKWNDQFNCVCLLNALFGNPNVHLVQLHPEFKGIKNYQRTKEIFANNNSEKLFIDGYNLHTDKKRKNALIEVLRFICQQQNKVVEKAGNNDELYQTTLEYLLNGDIQSAVNLLNINKKFKMAQHVAQCFTSEATKKLMQQEFETHKQLYSKFNQKAKAIINFMCGDLRMDGQDWQRQLLYRLLVKSNPCDDLEEVVSEFIKGRETPAQKQKDEQEGVDLLLVLISIYAFSQENFEDSQNRHGNYKYLYRQLLPYLSTLHMNFDRQQRMLIKKNNSYDHRISFIILWVLKSLSTHYQRNRNDYGLKYKSFNISDNYLTAAVSNYANQLILENDWKQALLISLLIPNSHSQTKNQLIFNVLMQKSLELTYESSLQTRGYIKSVLKVPPKYIDSALAIVYQYRGLYEKSMDLWRESGNYQIAHDVLMRRLVPLHFNTGKRKVSTQLIIKLNKILIQLFEKRDKIMNWDKMGEMLYQFIKKEEVTRGDPVMTNQWIEHISQHLSPIGVQQSDVLQRYIWEALLMIDSKLKLNLDTQILRGLTLLQKLRKIGSEKGPSSSIVSLYQTYPELARHYDGYITDIFPQVYSDYRNFTNIHGIRGGDTTNMEIS